jgi:hypothetical protein
VLLAALVPYGDLVICRVVEPAEFRLYYVFVESAVDDHRQRMAGGFLECVA